MKILLKQDLIIPKGTIFEDCTGLNVEYSSGNFESIIGTGRDGVINIFLNEDVISDDMDKFELLND